MTLKSHISSLQLEGEKTAWKVNAVSIFSHFNLYMPKTNAHNRAVVAARRAADASLPVLLPISCPHLAGGQRALITRGKNW